MNQASAKSVLDQGLADIEVPNSDEGIGLIDLLAILAMRKRLIAGAAIAGTVLAAVFALLMPNTYSATAMILPPQKDQSATTALLGQLGPLAAVAGADLKSPSDLYVGLLGSRTISDRLIGRFQLRQVYRTKTEIDTRSKLKGHSRISAGRDSLIKIEVEDVDPKRAAALANAYVAELNSLHKGLAITDAGERRTFLQKELEQERVALAAAEDAMKKQQARSGLIQPDAQTAVAIGSVAQLRAQITAGAVAIERLKMGATPQNPELARAETELASMRSQLRRLETGSPRGDILPSAAALPEAGLEYLRRLRDLKYHELLFELLSKQYEAARIDEGKATPSVQVVDPAIPPDKKSGPRRALIAFLGCLAGVIAASLTAYVQSMATTRQGNAATAQ